MPLLIDHIDAIARKRQRDVLMIRFAARSTDHTEHDYLRDLERRRVISWLDTHGIGWQPCGDVAQENCVSPYSGSIYVDVPYDTTDPTYEMLRDYLENPDGTMRYPTVTFAYCPLELARKNAHHDIPGFWDHLAEY